MNSSHHTSTLVSTLVCLALTACNSVTTKMDYKEYIIKAGNSAHDILSQGATQIPSALSGVRYMTFEARFDDSAKYSVDERPEWNLTPAEKSNWEMSINKLYGFSDCGANNPMDAHAASVRVGWRWTPSSVANPPQKDSVQLFAYTYANGSRYVPPVDPSIGEAEGTYIGSLLPMEWGKFSIAVTDTSYIVTLNGKSATHPRQCSGDQRGYQLTPFFGGEFAAPHEIKIVLKGLNNDYK